MKKVKGCLVVPRDENWLELQQLLQSTGDENPSVKQGKKRGDRLASFRVMRDNLMHQMESIVLQEAELGSALELLDYTKQKCDQQHDAIVQRLENCEEMLRSLEDGATESLPIESLLREQEYARWTQTKEMVTTILPQVLTRLEDNIDLNNAKIRDVRDKMEELRAKRLALREEIAAKEEDIALMLNDKAIY
ncbi:hypothetical protein F441_02369 [Phytophthora nicotianae CJ01A1]|uniref:Uncharacterized protein n=4 Tax=Phytophthora nicotianae TaxID=4792 RepID=W2ZZ15_PHYNI|nr:hypothetical protein L915_02298 [Phytophthora nicotianae]ETL48080.1 hypothetical protein L916_02258 [Phytophthora nicotianae]ETO83586.1 hypothetical protein F444_02402 [Phytophthora nicotianae P1976]ETP24660.1 hypothetical protein F441_02369 [Phytophthora nicotianae CJ01A1]ETP52622.1 hypothetical protein F442_02386 [Phytophthora nicotianae P10297]